MNNEFYEHKKSDAVKWIIVFVLIAVLIAGVVASLAVSLSDKIDTEEPETETETAAYANDFTAECFNSPNVKLAMNSAATVAADSSVSKTLTATVYPLDATNRLVDWSIAWSNQGKSEDVTDYVTVTPTYDGSSDRNLFETFRFRSDHHHGYNSSRRLYGDLCCHIPRRGYFHLSHFERVANHEFRQGRILRSSQQNLHDFYRQFEQCLGYGRFV